METANARPEEPRAPLKRYFAFAQARNAAVHPYGLQVGFDIFVGPGERAFPSDDGGEPKPSRRAIHGFVNVTHYATFEDELARGQRHSVSGDAAFCLVEKPDELLHSDWSVRRHGCFEVVPDHEVGAMLLMEAAAQNIQSNVGLFANGIASHGVRPPLQRGFVFRAGLIAKLPEGREPL